MAIYLDGSQLGLVGAEITALGDALAAVIAKKKFVKKTLVKLLSCQL